MTRLSHSAAEKFETCGKMYQLHYKDRIRSNKLGSALLFGSAIDEALNILLSTKMDNPPENATDDLERLKQGFDYHLANQIINKEMEDVRTSHIIEYYRSDFDPDVLGSAEFESLSAFIRDAGYEETEPLSLFEEIYTNIKDGQQIDSTDRSFYNYACWLSLKRKGHLMLEHYKEEIMPKIKRVISVQRAFKLPNESGDELVGYMDFEAEMHDYDGLITMDNKTSGKNYKLADVNDKGQLLIYDEVNDYGKAGYIVLIKKIAYIKEKTCRSCGIMTTKAVKKCAESIIKTNNPIKKSKKMGSRVERCNGELDLIKIPYIKSQILIDDIDEEKKDKHFEHLCGILEGIENEEFDQNRDSCFQYGKPCIYYNLCRSDPTKPDYKGLVKA